MSDGPSSSDSLMSQSLTGFRAVCSLVLPLVLGGGCASRQPDAPETASDGVARNSQPRDNTVSPSDNRNFDQEPATNSPPTRKWKSEPIVWVDLRVKVAAHEEREGVADLGIGGKGKPETDLLILEPSEYKGVMVTIYHDGPTTTREPWSDVGGIYDVELMTVALPQPGMERFPTEANIRFKSNVKQDSK